MSSHNEQQLLKIIKYIPTLFLIFISMIVITFLYLEYDKSLESQKDLIQKNYIQKNKDYIKHQTENTYSFVLYKQDTTEKELKDKLKKEMQKAYSIAFSIYENNKNIKDEATIKKLIKDAIRPIRFNNGRGYFFIHDKNIFANTMHPIFPKLEGKNSYNVKDTKGNYIIRQMHELLKEKNESTFQWHWYKPNDKKTQYKKIGYIKNFTPYNWFIGTGEYLVDFEKEIQAHIIDDFNAILQKENINSFIINSKGKILTKLNKPINNKNIKFILDNQRNGFLTDKKEVLGDVNYLKLIPKWDWIIVSSFSKETIGNIIEERKNALDKSIEQNITNTTVIFITLSIFLFALCVYFAKIVNKKFKKYKKEINKHLDAKIEHEKILSQQAKMAAMGEMIGNIAHQWRQPLSSITSNATAMIVQKEMNLLDDSSLKNGLKEINKKSQFLSTTIDDFRNFFNSDKHKSKFIIKDSIHDAITLLDSPFKRSDIQIVENISHIEIKNYRNEFVQVIINILNNAKDALKNKHKDKFILIDVHKTESSIEIIIKDSAGGINEEIMDKIFDPYFTTKHQFQGTGIGLYMSNEIITKHMNGTIEASNEEFIYENRRHKGASFKISLDL